jgi:hypothetical protein
MGWPTIGACLVGLVNEFQKSGFDVRHLMRTIMRSRLYQLDSQPNEHNAEDTRFYSHYRVKRIAAESLLDCIDDGYTPKSLRINYRVER